MLKALSAIALAIALPTALDAQVTKAPAASSQQDHSMSCMDHGQMAGMDQMKMNHSAMAGMDMSAMDHSMAGTAHPAMAGSCAMQPKASTTSDRQGHSH